MNCLTNSKHQHIGAKGAFCGLQICQNEFSVEAPPGGEVMTLPRTPQSAVEGTPLPYFTSLGASILRLRRSPFSAFSVSIWWGIVLPRTAHCQ